MVDGEGISKEDAEDGSFKHLKLIMEHYFWDVDRLEVILKSIINEHSVGKVGWEKKGCLQEDCYWILKLLKMKAGKEYVEPLLRSLFNRK